MRTKLVLTTLAALATVSCVGHKPKELPRLSAEQIAARSTPATLLIINEFEVSLDVHRLTIDIDKLVTARNNRLGPGNHMPSETYLATLDVFLSDPSGYLVVTDKVDTQKMDHPLWASGSGLTITPDGYVVTNAHVVKLEPEDILGAAVSLIQGLADKQVQDLQDEVTQLIPGRTVKPEVEQRFRTAVEKAMMQNAKVKEVRQQMFALTGTGPDSTSRKIPAEVKKLGEALSARDVAILKMEGDDFPTVPLAESLSKAGVQTGQALTVMGFPGHINRLLAMVRTGISDSEPIYVDPTLTTGTVGAIRTFPDGSKVVQTEAQINHGNSGGPVFDDRGEVIGLATFSPPKAENTGLNFAVSIDVVRDYLSQANVHPEESEFTRKYDAALEAKERGQTSKARQLFRELNQAHPESSAVWQRMQDLGDRPEKSTEARAQSGTRSSNSSTSHSSSSDRSERHPGMILLVIGGVLALVVVIVVLANR
jgi:S1-C subfamily serine protease